MATMMRESITGDGRKNGLRALLYRWTQVICLGISMASLGCVTRETLPPTREQVFQEFAPSEEASLTQPSGARSVGHFDLYRDVSGSASGFASYAWSEYNAVLAELLRRISTSGYELSQYAFAGEVVPMSSSMSGSFVVEPGNRSGSSFINLVEHIASGRLDGRVAIVITDLVQSDNLADQSALSRAFGGLVRDGYVCTVLAFQSSFRGTYWVESSRGEGQTYRLDLRDEYDGNSRPFYVLIVAPSASSLAAAEEALAIHELDFDQAFPEPGMRIWIDEAKIVLDDTESSSESPWIAFDSFSIAEDQHGGTRIWAPISHVAPPHIETEPLRVNLTLDDASKAATGRIKEGDRIRVQVDAKTWTSSGWLDKKVKQKFAEVLFQPEDPTHLSLILRLEPPEFDTFDYYRVQLSAGTNNLRSPPWVDQWTTDDDVNPDRASRTLHLDRFIEVLRRVTSEKTTFIDLFLEVRRGNQ